MRLEVNVFGVINDQKFNMTGSGNIDPKTGNADIRLGYSCCPPDWNPMNYSDPLVLLAGYREENGGVNFMTLSDGSYRAESTIDFGGGLSLRKTATVKAEGDVLIAEYSLFGAARLARIKSIEPYEEYMIPAGDGQIIAVGLAKWNTADGMVQAVVSSRYFFESKRTLKYPQIRRFKVDAELQNEGLEYYGRYSTSVAPVKT